MDPALEHPSIVQFNEETNNEWLATRNNKDELNQKAVHFMVLGVLPQYQGNGIAQAMIRASLIHIKAMGYSLVYTTAASIESQKIYSKLGFRKVIDKKYREFVYNGERVFEGIKELESVIVFEKDIQEFVVGYDKSAKY